MHGRNSGMAALFVASMMASAHALGNGAHVVIDSSPQHESRSDSLHMPSFTGSRKNYGGPGTSAAQIKRASKKARNVRRHKSHTKGT